MEIYLLILVECLIWKMKCIVAFQLMHSLASLLISIFGCLCPFGPGFLHGMSHGLSSRGCLSLLPLDAAASTASMAWITQPSLPMHFSLQPGRWDLIGSQRIGCQFLSLRNNRLCLLELSCNIRAVRWGSYQPGHLLEVRSLRPWVVNWRAPHFGSLSSLWFMNVINSKNKQDRHNTIK